MNITSLLLAANLCALGYLSVQVQVQAKRQLRNPVNNKVATDDNRVLQSSRRRHLTEFASREAWLEALGTADEHLTCIDFHDYPNQTVITTQYSARGIMFTDDDDTILAHPAFVRDGFGLGGNNTKIHIHLDAHDATAIGVDFPGALRIRLLDYNDAEVAVSQDFAGRGTGFFGGITEHTFSKVIMEDWLDSWVFIDRLCIHFDMTSMPSVVPTTEPTSMPSVVPTSQPTSMPSAAPTSEPSASPTPAPEITSLWEAILAFFGWS